MRFSLSTARTSIAWGAGLVVMSLPLTGCGLGGIGGAPEPVAVVGQLKGNATEIKLDRGFIKALGQLDLTPGVAGGAKLDKDTLSFPITGGNVTVFRAR